MVRKSRGNGASRRCRSLEKLEVGQKVRDSRNGQEGTVLDSACQYAHPKADPVYSYLVQWDDGQVHAISEYALEGNYGIDLVD